jgi:hypothetical protein
VLLAFLSCALWLFAQFDCSGFGAAGAVKIGVTNLPGGTRYASVVADSGGQIQNMDWLVKTAMIRGRMHPQQCVWSYHDGKNPKINWDAYVCWVEGERYGVLTCNEKDEWRVTWFGSDVRRNSVAHFDITKGTPGTAIPEQVQSLGLEKVQFKVQSRTNKAGEEPPVEKR